VKDGEEKVAFQRTRRLAEYKSIDSLIVKGGGGGGGELSKLP